MLSHHVIIFIQNIQDLVASVRGSSAAVVVVVYKKTSIYGWNKERTINTLYIIWRMKKELDSFYFLVSNPLPLT
jgi:hypothetical protein